MFHLWDRLVSNRLIGGWWKCVPPIAVACSGSGCSLLNVHSCITHRLVSALQRGEFGACGLPLGIGVGVALSGPIPLDRLPRITRFGIQQRWITGRPPLQLCHLRTTAICFSRCVNAPVLVVTLIARNRHRCADAIPWLISCTKAADVLAKEAKVRDAPRRS